MNYGPGAVSASTVLIHWPYEVENGYDQGKHLLYLMEEPTVLNLLKNRLIVIYTCP